MRVDFKIQAWERVEIPDEHTDAVIEAIKSGEIETSQDLFEFLEDDCRFEGTIPETETYTQPTEDDPSITVGAKGEGFIYTNLKEL